LCDQAGKDLAQHVLDEDVFPMVGWPGPGGGLIRDDVMGGMAAVSTSSRKFGAGMLFCRGSAGLASR
jgi:hypothetical protein